MILAIDPGKDKCGIAILEEKGVSHKEVVKCSALAERIKEIIPEYSISEIVIGSGTSCRSIKSLVESLNLGLPIKEFDEKFSTLEARKFYWEENPPKGLLKIIPRTLLFPPRPIDDFAAVILGRRYLQRKS